MKLIITAIAALFLLAGCAPFMAAAVYHVGAGFTGDSGVVEPIKCFGVACENDKAVSKAAPKDDPAPDVPDDDPDAPDDDHDKGHGNNPGHDPDNPGKKPHHD